ncbi:hypothetical protein DLAC_10893 [Tieghemostelium lacteum]|uniref:Peptidase S9 prolyl oligopeptidase catalytic domain-containing protein n=1 Tax=Tieghemostelium lacteum TaxID=361077 RepID=A0A151Z2Q6_TIELA|nr:hypothetical protein DLAC_10893 [Tieghemostelium lacteum]|eukprot:KYQ88207.1 hypothetical protein DLAC_10893 [Tieghemostelium lacteum]
MIKKIVFYSLLFILNLNFLHSLTSNGEKRIDFFRYQDIISKKSQLYSDGFYIQSFDVIGPFPSAPREDADVLEAFGGITNIPRADNSTYPSDLVFGGQTGWSVVSSSDQSGYIEIGYSNDQVNWTLIEEWAGSSGSYFSGWALGDFQLEQQQTVVIQCAGVSKFFVDDIVMQGDTYASGIQFNSIDLSPGNHTVRVRLQGQEGAEFLCFVLWNSPTSSQSIMVIEQDILQPSIIQGQGFVTPYVSIAILNLLSETINEIQVTSQLEDIEIKILPSVNSNNQSYTYFEVGQLKPINMIIWEEQSSPAANCTVGQLFQIPIQIQVGSDSFSGTSIEVLLNFTCIQWGQPYVFTFLDFDESVQYAATTPPINPCPEDGCPVLLTFHGADVEAKSHAWTSAYSRQNNSWILFPTNRRNYGFDWQGPGIKNGFTALTILSKLLPGVPPTLRKISGANEWVVQYAGHSMGGHGCDVASTHRPDRALSVSVAAGWISMELYTPFFLKLGYSWADPYLRFLLEASISEYNSDLYSPHLINLPLLVRMGSVDENVPPTHLRRMNRLYGQLRHNNTAGEVSEIRGEGHWFSGVVDDEIMQQFFNHYQLSSLPTLTNRFVVTTLNPSSFESKGGISIQQLLIPYRISKIQVSISTVNSSQWTLTSENVARFGFVTTYPYRPATIILDGQQFPYIQLPQHYCQNTQLTQQKRKSKKRNSTDGPWSICQDSNWQILERSPLNYGPLAQVIEYPLLIVYGSLQSETQTNISRNYGVYLSNVLYYQERYSIPVVPDYQVSLDDMSMYNFILIGGPQSNKISQSLEDVLPVQYSDNTGNTNSFQIGSNVFSLPNTGIAFLSPCYDQQTVNTTSQIRPGCMLAVLDGTDNDGLQQAINMFPTKSTIQMPDFAVAGPTYSYASYSGLLAVGFWDNNWNYNPSLSYITSIVN